jgi:hypothetical protein
MESPRASEFQDDDAKKACERQVRQAALYLLAIFWARKTPMTLPMKLPPTIRTMKGQKLSVAIPISL